MEIRDWIMLVSMIVVILGWFLNSYLNRKHEIAKKRLDYRLEALINMLDSLLLIRNMIDVKKDIGLDLDKISEYHLYFQLYANKDELYLLNKFIESDFENKYNPLNKLIFLLRKRIRKELDLPYFKLQLE